MNSVQVGVIHIATLYRKEEANPEIIYASLNGYGQTGLKKETIGLDLQLQAGSGLMDRTGFPEGAPTKGGPAMGDQLSGTYMANAIMLALIEKEKSGKGQYIDVAMYDTLFGIMESPIMCKLLNDEEITRCGNTDPTLFPYYVYPCKDGYFSVGLAAGSNKEWKRFCEAIDRMDLFENEKYLDNGVRVEEYDVLTPEILEWFKDKSEAELEEIFNEYAIPNSPVRTIPELNVDPQLDAREMLIPMNSPAIGEFKATGNPMKMDLTPAVIEKPAPLLGADTAKVLAELGYSQDDIAKFGESGVI